MTDLEKRLRDLCYQTYGDLGIYPHPMLVAIHAAARIGAEDMRERCAAACLPIRGAGDCKNAIRALPLPGDEKP